MKPNRNRIARTFYALIAMTLTLGTAITLFGASTVQSAQDEKVENAEKAEVAAAPAAAPTDQGESRKAVITTSAADSCLSDPVVLDEISKKRQDLEAREKELQNKETELKARETAINDELKKLQDLRDQVAQLDDAHRAANQEKVAKVIETLQAMSPKASAQFLTTLDDSLAVSAIAQMDTTKLAKIMNVIDAKRGAKLTELLAGVVRAHDSSGADASRGIASTASATETTSSPQIIESAEGTSLKKGGKENDSTNNKSESIISGPELSAKAQ